MRERLLVASTNAGKALEFVEALEGFGYDVVTLRDVGADASPAPEETGSTFAENALLKARYYHVLTGLMTVADDSGLEVAILGGRPGIQSARYGATDRERIAKLLGELDGVPTIERGARFVCSIALVGEGVEQVVTGECHGRIRHVAQGTHGFGFDPVFSPDGDARTFAEMTSAEKRAVSHRGRAISALASLLAGR